MWQHFISCHFVRIPLFFDFFKENCSAIQKMYKNAFLYINLFVELQLPYEPSSLKDGKLVPCYLRSTCFVLKLLQLIFCILNLIKIFIICVKSLLVTRSLTHALTDWLTYITSVLYVIEANLCKIKKRWAH